LIKSCLSETNCLESVLADRADDVFDDVADRVRRVRSAGRMAAGVLAGCGFRDDVTAQGTSGNPDRDEPIRDVTVDVRNLVDEVRRAGQVIPGHDHEVWTLVDPPADPDFAVPDHTGDIEAVIAGLGDRPRGAADQEDDIENITGDIARAGAAVENTEAAGAGIEVGDGKTEARIAGASPGIGPVDADTARTGVRFADISADAADIERGVADTVAEAEEGVAEIADRTRPIAAWNAGA
jgi:hypothetical protein